MAVTASNQSLDRTKCIKQYSPGTPTLRATANYTSQDLNGITLNWTTVDVTVRETLCFSFGDAVQIDWKPREEEVDQSYEVESYG